VSFTLKGAAVLFALNWVYEAGKAAERADAAEQEAAIVVTRTAAAEGAASAISAIKLESRTVVQRTREVTRDVPVYRDCLHDERVFGDLNQQLRGAGKSAD
jgi:hypothetical protein